MELKLDRNPDFASFFFLRSTALILLRLKGKKGLHNRRSCYVTSGTGHPSLVSNKSFTGSWHYHQQPQHTMVKWSQGQALRWIELFWQVYTKSEVLFLVIPMPGSDMTIKTSERSLNNTEIRKCNRYCLKMENMAQSTTHKYNFCLLHRNKTSKMHSHSNHSEWPHTSSSCSVSVYCPRNENP